MRFPVQQKRQVLKTGRVPAHSRRTSHSPFRYCGTSMRRLYSQQTAKISQMRGSSTLESLIDAAKSAL